jgi:hypothetical protein
MKHQNKQTKHWLEQQENDGVDVIGVPKPLTHMKEGFLPTEPWSVVGEIGEITAKLGNK